MTTVPKPADPTAAFTCTYDAWNRMVKVEEGMTTIGEYAYDLLKRRVTKEIDSVVRHFLYSSEWQSLEERLDSSTDPERQQIWGPQYVDQLLLRDRDTSDPFNGALNERVFALQDANWNVVSLIGESGGVAERYRFTVYGAVTTMDEGFGTRASTNLANPITFTGRLHDIETDLFQYRTRYYDALLGLFASRDPRTYEGSAWSLYRYVDNLPSSRVDPSGQQPEDPENYTCLISKEVFVKEARAAVVCRKGRVDLEVFKNIVDPCELYCTELHERHHLVQIARVCPDICCDADEGYPYFVDEEVRRGAECAAHDLTIRCLDSYVKGERPEEKSRLPIPFTRAPDPSRCDKEAVLARRTKELEIFRDRYDCFTRYKDPADPSKK